MSYLELTKTLTSGVSTQGVVELQTPSVQAVAQDLVVTENAIREALSKIAPTHGRSVVREPPIDMYDEGDRIVLMVDMPGIPKENIKVRVTIDSVEISASPVGGNSGKVLKAERMANFRLYRKVSLPCKIKISEVRAYLKDGVLYIYLPKLLDATETLDVSIE